MNALAFVLQCSIVGLIAVGIVAWGYFMVRNLLKIFKKGK